MANRNARRGILSVPSGVSDRLEPFFRFCSFCTTATKKPEHFVDFLSGLVDWAVVLAEVLDFQYSDVICLLIYFHYHKYKYKKY